MGNYYLSRITAKGGKGRIIREALHIAYRSIRYYCYNTTRQPPICVGLYIIQMSKYHGYSDILLCLLFLSRKCMRLLCLKGDGIARATQCFCRGTGRTTMDKLGGWIQRAS